MWVLILVSLPTSLIGAQVVHAIWLVPIHLWNCLQLPTWVGMFFLWCWHEGQACSHGVYLLPPKLSCTLGNVLVNPMHSFPINGILLGCLPWDGVQLPQVLQCFYTLDILEDALLHSSACVQDPLGWFGVIPLLTLMRDLSPVPVPNPI